MEKRFAFLRKKSSEAITAKMVRPINDTETGLGPIIGISAVAAATAVTGARMKIIFAPAGRVLNGRAYNGISKSDTSARDFLI